MMHIDTDRLTAAAHDLATPEEQMEIAAHLDACPACLDGFARLSAERAALESVGRRPRRDARPWLAAAAAAPLFAALGLAAVLWAGRPTGAAAGQDKPAIEVRLTVANFYRAKDGTMMSAGTWEFACADGAAKGVAKFSLTPETADGKKREGAGEITREQAAALIAGLRKDGLFTAADAKKCKCDAPVFAVSAKEGAAKNAFTLMHDHDDHDGAQRRLIEGIIAAVETHAAPRPAVKVRLEVSNYYKDGAGTFWSSGVWEIDAAEGADAATVRLALEPSKKGDEPRALKGSMTRGDVAVLVEALRKAGVFTAKDGQACLCDAPVFVLTAREGDQRNTFRLAHNHDNADDPQRGMVETVIKVAEKHATTTK